MTEIQTASLPHALVGRDVLVAAKKRSGKTLAFVVPVLEKLFRERYTPGRGVGSIILCPTRELACQTSEVFKSVARHHSFSIGLLTGGGNSVGLEKEHGNDINLLVCTPAALFIQMERVNLDCSQLKVLVLDDVDSLPKPKFGSILNAVVSQLPEKRQTLMPKISDLKDGSRMEIEPESPFKFVAFHAGPRICLGKEFGYRQMKILSIALLCFFRFKLADDTKPVNYRAIFTLHIDGNLTLCAVSRTAA